MTGPAVPAVAHVRMPERGVFMVRCAEGVRPNAGEAVVVALDYGEDMGTALSQVPQEASATGRRAPGFRALRVATADDVERAEGNARLARRMAAEFAELVESRCAVSVRVPHARLSLARARLFLRFVAPRGVGGLSRVVDEFQTRHGVQVNARQVGLREEVALVGAIGPCGRPCCCSTWQTRCPRGVGAEAEAKAGVCGCRRCCLSF